VAFLNSTIVDVYFRQFNGHTQVNAQDLRALRYPERSALIAIGRRLGETLPEQNALDVLVEEVIKRNEDKHSAPPHRRSARHPHSVGVTQGTAE
jgi:adenine-specific DNA-methyltransferase